ncbi:hypothetical protein ACFQ1R_11180 [Mariniflexile jejuense]|uniref:YD repeat-containing protein n=1 Tax=Mariniflexile jejuense TaxID=1173582 RepID=A0ABW3JMY3_9FLAO
MKNTIIICLCIICFVLNTNAQNNTTEYFNLPKTTTVFVTGVLKYNGETKQITPTEQIQYEFKNGLLLKEMEVKVIGSLKFGSQKIYTYNTNNELTNISDSDGMVDGGASHQDYKITYSKTGNSVFVYRNSQSYMIKVYNTNGKLLEDHFYDYHSKYIFSKHIYKDGIKITQNLNSENKITEETTEYLNKNNEPLVKVVFVPSNSYRSTVTYFTYNANGDLQTTTTCTYNRDKLKANFEYFKDGKATEVPKEALSLTPTTTTYYNYSEGTTWTARASSKLFTNEIEVSVRALQTSDSKQNNIINNQAAFMAFLDTTYQKIKAQKP